MRADVLQNIREFQASHFLNGRRRLSIGNAYPSYEKYVLNVHLRLRYCVRAMHFLFVAVNVRIVMNESSEMTEGGLYG